MSVVPFAEVRAPASYDVLAPDGSEIRLLVQTARGSMVHCTLPVGATSAAVAHRTVDELWYCLGGAGEVWRAQGERQSTTAVSEP